LIYFPLNLNYLFKNISSEYNFNYEFGKHARSDEAKDNRIRKKSERLNIRQTNTATLSILLAIRFILLTRNVATFS